MIQLYIYLAQAFTYSVPHNNVDVTAEGVVEVLGDVQIDKVAEMMVHVHPWEDNDQMTTRDAEIRLKQGADLSVCLR